MSDRPADRLLVRAHEAVQQHAASIFVEAVPWRTAATVSDQLSPTIPGALRVGVKQVFAGEPRPGSGHLPLPDAAAVRARAAQWRTAKPGARIIVFTRDRRDLTSATRAWFTLSWAGVGGVRVLLGGLAAWEAAGGALGGAAGTESEATHVGDERLSVGQPGTDAAGLTHDSAWPVRVIDADALRERGARGTVLDGRPAAHYAGFADDPRSGHVPGAVSAPATELLTADGTLKAPADLRRWLLERGGIGAHPVAAYCHGGVASSSLVFAAALLGQQVDLYVDSWSAWAERADLPVARGAARGHGTGDDFSCFDPL